MHNNTEENKKPKESFSSTSFGIGGTLIMVIFVSLCLTIFATLSFTTAYSDLKLSKKTQEMTKDYYVASGRAEEKLSQIYDKLLIAKSDLDKQVNDSKYLLENYNILAKKRVMELGDLKMLDCMKDSKNNILTVYYESLGDLNQKICVTLNIYLDEIKIEPYYKIVSWNLSNIEIPSYEENVYDLWEGID